MNLEMDTVRILIERVRDGDRAAQSELVQQIQSYVTIMADHSLDPSIRAQVGPSDIVQQTMIKMIDGIGEFNGNSKPEFFGWLNTIVQNEALKSLRDLTRQKRDVRRQKSLSLLTGDSARSFAPVESKMTPPSAAVANERINLFHEALAKLSPDYATVIRLRNLDQLAFPEIAERMGRTPNSVSKLWIRAVVKFKKELEALDDNSRAE